MLGRYEEAEASFRRAVELQPEEPLHWLNLGDTELVLGAEETAQESYRRGADRTGEQLTINPENTIAFKRLAALSENGKQPGAAAESSQPLGATSADVWTMRPSRSSGYEPFSPQKTV